MCFPSYWQYFLNYNECLSNNFVFAKGGKSLELTNSDIHDWKITFADTGLRSNKETFKIEANAKTRNRPRHLLNKSNE